MSSYDERNIIQIAVDELISKYKIRLRELELLAKKYREDEEVLRRLNLLLADLCALKVTVDKVSKKGGLNGKKI
jgi:hypothetical protein